MASKPQNFKDSGKRSEFSTGAVRDLQEGKGRMDLMPVRALIEVSKIMETGARKYAARNWEQGIPLSRFMDSGIRHALKWLRGDRDEPHLAMACWNLLCLLDTQGRIEEGLLPAELNDLPNNPIQISNNPLKIQATVNKANFEVGPINEELRRKALFDTTAAMIDRGDLAKAAKSPYGDAT